MDSGGGTMIGAKDTMGGMGVFTIVWLGQLVSLTGSSLTGFALGVWVYQSTGSVTQFALISFCTVIPGVVVAPFTGALVDRWDHRRTMMLSDAGAGLSTLALACLLFLGHLQIWHIYVVVAIASVLSAFQLPAYSAAVTSMVRKEHLGRANGMIQIGWAVAQLAGPFLGALMLEAVKLEGVILLDFMTFFCAFLALLCVRFSKRGTVCSGGVGRAPLFREIAQGWTYILSRPGIASLLLFFTAFYLFIGVVQVLVTPLVLSFASTVAVGSIMSAGGLGMLVGGVVLSVTGGPERRMRAIFASILLGGVCMALAGLTTSVILLAVLSFFYFMALPIVNVCSQVILQRKVAPGFQGRVFALRMTSQGAALGLGYALAGPLADHVFEPLMAAQGFLANSVGELIGVGPGRGVALMFEVVGVLLIALTIIAHRYPRLRLVEEEIPDAFREREIDGEPEGLGASI